MASRRPRRYLKTFLEPVASFSQSMSPFRAMATPFVPEITKSYRTLSSRITDFLNLFSFFDFLAGTLRGLDPSQKMHIDCTHLQKGWYGGSISHQRLILLGFCGLQGTDLFCLAGILGCWIPGFRESLQPDGQSTLRGGSAALPDHKVGEIPGTRTTP